MSALRQIILDTETTGLEPTKGHRIIEIGAIEVVNRQATRRTFHCYLNPEREVEEGALRVHGISNHFLKDKPLFTHVVDELLEFIQDAELVIHNAPFDIGFLNHELTLVKRPKIETLCRVFDTLPFARQKHPGQKNSLDALCKRYNVDNTNRTYHGALLDAQLLLEVYLQLTGGQKSFLDKADEVTPLNQSKEEAGVTRFNPPLDLPVIIATNAEVELHQAYLKKIKAESTAW